MRSRRVRYHYPRKQPCCRLSLLCAFMWVLLLGFFATFIILAVTSPNEHHHHYAKNIGPNDCSLSEKYNHNLKLCTPITNTPIPISHTMMDHSVDKCDSFFKHMNGHWISNHTNQDRSFLYVYQKNMKEIYDIIRDPKSGSIYKFYRSCRDTLVHNQHKYITNAQIKHVTENILGSLNTHADLPIVFAKLAKHGYNYPFSITIEKHPTKNEMIPLFRFDTVPDLENDLAKRLRIFQNVSESSIEESFIDYVKGSRFNNDLIKMGELIDVSPTNFWKEFLTELNGVSSLEAELIVNNGTQKVWVLDRSYMIKMLSSLNEFTIKEWKEFVASSIKYNTNNFLPVLPTDSYFRKHDVEPIGINIFLDHKLKKDLSIKYTDEQCLMTTHKMLPGLIGKAYLKRDMKHSEKTRSRLTQMTKNLIDTFSEIIQETEWMSLETKKKSVDKIRSIIVRVIHPNLWESELFAERIQIDRYLKNLNMVRQFRSQRNFELWRSTRKSMNRDTIQRFGSPLSTTNAFYSPSSNTITIFAGIVTDPFYDERFNDIGMYAGLGMVISHELSHSLDNNGRLFDLNGNLKTWWKDSDIQRFKEKTQCVINQYKAPKSCDSEDYGEKTLGENMADITGIKISYRSWLKNEPNATKTEKQQFFKVFSQIWASSFDEKHTCQQVESQDPHSVPKMRVDVTLRQLSEFKKSFDCKNEDKMVNEKMCVVYGK